MILVTIGIPVYNSEEFIKETIESALNQTFKNIEILVIDDCGSDSSISIVKNIQKNHPRGNIIRIISHKDNKGVASSRNTILKEANGDLLFFLDSDDYISPNCIQILYNTLKKEGVDIAIGSYKKRDYLQEKDELVVRCNQILKNNDDFLKQIFIHRYIDNFFIWNILFDIKFIRNNNLYFKETKIGEDVIFYFDFMFLVQRIAILSEVTYIYSIRKNSLSQFNSRAAISLKEVETQIYYRTYKKIKFKEFISNMYSGYIAADIMTDCWYAAISIVNKQLLIYPRIEKKHMNELFKCPYSISDIILKFKNNKIKCLFFLVFGKLPTTSQITILEYYIKRKK